MVSNPGIGVQNRILQVLIAASVEAIAAALGDDANLSADRASILGGVVGSQYLHLLDGVEVRHADRISAGADSNRDGSVVGDQVIAIAAAVNLNGSQARRVIEARNIAGCPGTVRGDRTSGTAGDARLGQRGVDRVSTIQRQVLNLVAGNHTTQGRRVGLKRRLFRSHLDAFGIRAQCQGNVDGSRNRWIDGVIRDRLGRESRSRYGDGVLAGRETVDAIESRVIGSSPAAVSYTHLRAHETR